MDPLVGIIGAVIIAQWALALLKNAMQMLLDWQPANTLLADIKSKIESDGESQIADLHLWQVAPGRNAAIVSVITHEQRQPDDYKLRLSGLGLAHITIELNHCAR